MAKSGDRRNLLAHVSFEFLQGSPGPTQDPSEGAELTGQCISREQT